MAGETVDCVPARDAPVIDGTGAAYFVFQQICHSDCVLARFANGQISQVLQRRIHPVAAQRGDVRVTPPFRKNRQHKRLNHLPLRPRVRVLVFQPAFSNQCVGAASDFRIFGKQRQLTRRRRRHVQISFKADRTAEGVQFQRLSGDILRSAEAITCRLILSGRSPIALCPGLRRFPAVGLSIDRRM